VGKMLSYAYQLLFNLKYHFLVSFQGLSSDTTKCVFVIQKVQINGNNFNRQVSKILRLGQLIAFHGIILLLNTNVICVWSSFKVALKAHSNMGFEP
jgi:hypothetical protein